MNKKGFTLIELLAVIVILAIIALIATPIVLNIINDAKEESGLRSADFYLDAVELGIAQATLKGQNINDGTYNILENGNICLVDLVNGSCPTDKILTVEVKGEVPSGTVTIANGQISGVEIVLNDKTILKDDKGELSYKEIKKPKSFAEDDWDTIIANVKAGNISVYEKNLKENTNNTKTIELAGFGEKTVRIANVSTPEECKTEGFSQTACGFVVEFVDIITEHAMNSDDSNVGGWRDSEMRKYVNNDILNSFPENLQKNILTTYTVSGHEDGATENYKTNDKLYLLSTKEVWGKEGTDRVIEYDTAEAETRQLDYYKKIGVTTENYRGAVKKYRSASYWWLRSAISDETDNFSIVKDGGDWNAEYASFTLGLVVAFRI